MRSQRNTGKKTLVSPSLQPILEEFHKLSYKGSGTFCWVSKIDRFKLIGRSYTVSLWEKRGFFLFRWRRILYFRHWHEPEGRPAVFKERDLPSICEALQVFQEANKEKNREIEDAYCIGEETIKAILEL